MQDFSAGSGIAVPKHFEISKADLGTRAIRRDFERAIVTGSSGRPVTQPKVIVAGEHSDVSVAGIEGQSAFEAFNRFAPTSLPPIDATNISVGLGIIRRSRRGDLELLKSCVVMLLSPIEAKT